MIDRVKIIVLLVILERVMWFSRFPPGEIRLTSLEAMEAGDWEWHTVA